MMSSALYCCGPECDRPAFRGVTGGQPLCAAHLKQQQRTGKLTPIAPELTPEARVVEAAIALLDADASDDRGYESRRRALLNAAALLGMKMLAAQGWRPPRGLGRPRARVAGLGARAG